MCFCGPLKKKHVIVTPVSLESRKLEVTLREAQEMRVLERFRTLEHILPEAAGLWGSGLFVA